MPRVKGNVHKQGAPYCGENGADNLEEGLKEQPFFDPVEGKKKRNRKFVGEPFSELHQDK